MSESTNLKLTLTPESEWETKKFGTLIDELTGTASTSNMNKIDAAYGSMKSMLEGHASRHSASGADPITPASIGASKPPVVYSETTTTNGWVYMSSVGLYYHYCGISALDSSKQLIMMTPTSDSIDEAKRCGFRMVDRWTDDGTTWHDEIALIADIKPEDELTYQTIVIDL